MSEAWSPPDLLHKAVAPPSVLNFWGAWPLSEKATCKPRPELFSQNKDWNA